jgi:enoyl-CoA hydratase/carnithine racemase
MSESGDIAIDMAGGVATLRLRNPARRNAVSAAMWRAIHAFASGWARVTMCVRW